MRTRVRVHARVSLNRAKAYALEDPVNRRPRKRNASAPVRPYPDTGDSDRTAMAKAHLVQRLNHRPKWMLQQAEGKQSHRQLWNETKRGQDKGRNLQAISLGATGLVGGI